MDYRPKVEKTNKSDRMSFSRLTRADSVLTRSVNPLPLDHHAPFLNQNLWSRLLLPDTTEVMRYDNN